MFIDGRGLFEYFYWKRMAEKQDERNKEAERQKQIQRLTVGDYRVKI